MKSRVFCLLLLILAGRDLSANVFPEKITQLFEVGNILVDTVDVAYESFFSAVGLTVIHERMKTGRIVRRLAIRALWEEILKRAGWPAAEGKKLERRLAIAKVRWSREHLSVTQSMYAWFVKREALKIRIAAYIGSRSSLETIRSPRKMIKTILREGLRATSWEVLDEQWFAGKVTEYVPDSMFDAIR